MDLVSPVWPSDDFYPLKVQLYVLMSPQGCYTDVHVDMGGSSIWYHLVSGRKGFLVAPPSARNLEAFKEWAPSQQQGSVFFGERGGGVAQNGDGSGRHAADVRLHGNVPSPVGVDLRMQKQLRPMRHGGVHEALRGAFCRRWPL